MAHLKSKRPTAIYNEGWYRRDSEYYGKHRDAIGGALSTVRRTAEALALRMILTDTLMGTDVPLSLLGDLNDGAAGCRWTRALIGAKGRASARLAAPASLA